MAKKKITESQKSVAELEIKSLQQQIDYDLKDFTIELIVQKFERDDFWIPRTSESTFGKKLTKVSL